ncbi:ricin B lectin domain-containing protein [Panaeolus papilionaceus]|nr:ricin B lectin domain-containing protein [Panaeolus papilionaceus]
MLLPILFTSLFFNTLFAQSLAGRLFTIVNRCPESISPFINGVNQGTLSPDGMLNITFTDNWSGLIYTSANGGSSTGAGTTRAGFFGDAHYYYIVKDASSFNTGVMVVPNAAPANSFCEPIGCDSTSCPAVFNQPPASFPVPGDTAPTQPLFQCPSDASGYRIVFCPERTFPPPPDSLSIHPSSNTNKCIDVRGGQFTNGTNVQIWDCNNTAAQRWTFPADGTKGAIKLAGTQMCLDAGSVPNSGTTLKLWQCIDNSPAQTWTYVNQTHFQLDGSTQCMDLMAGSTIDGTPIQTWTCQELNANQLWTF